MENAAMNALKQAQEAFAGEAERQGLQSEQDVMDLVKDVRREAHEKANEAHQKSAQAEAQVQEGRTIDADASINALHEKHSI